jgi:hypothetical protein
MRCLIFENINNVSLFTELWAGPHAIQSLLKKQQANEQSSIKDHSELLQRHPEPLSIACTHGQNLRINPMMSLFPSLNFTMSIQRLLAAGLAASFPFSSNPATNPAPVVNVLNGSYTGVHNEFYNQDLFLGIPYAQPPVGDLRFRAPFSLNSTWNGTRAAMKYSDIVSRKPQLTSMLLIVLSAWATGQVTFESRKGSALTHESLIRITLDLLKTA